MDVKCIFFLVILTLGQPLVIPGSFWQLRAIGSYLCLWQKCHQCLVLLWELNSAWEFWDVEEYPAGQWGGEVALGLVLIHLPCKTVLDCQTTPEVNLCSRFSSCAFCMVWRVVFCLKHSAYAKILLQRRQMPQLPSLGSNIIFLTNSAFNNN